MASVKILVVDDDLSIRTLVHRYLIQQNYEVESAEDGETALILFREFQPDLVILDINLPDTTGFLLCQEMQSYKDVFILMLTSLADEGYKVKGLDVGADDYLTKPFGLVELSARVRAILKRQKLPSQKTSSQTQSNQLIFGDLVIDSTRKEVKFKNKILPLTNIQFDILFCMASQAGYAWKRSELYEKVWDSQWLENAKCADVHISQIRKKIKEAGCDFEYIKTVWKIGYKFEDIPQNSSISILNKSS
jgi:DNA-binding response OmpR family regulator